MKTFFPLLLFCAFSLLAIGQTQAQDGVLRHVVTFKFKADATDEQIEALITAFAGLKDQISEIKGFEWGTNNSPEGLDKGLTHCFIVTFDNEEGRDIYLPHPAHKAFVETHGKIIDDVFVIDYYAKEGL